MHVSETGSADTMRPRHDLRFLGGIGVAYGG